MFIEFKNLGRTNSISLVIYMMKMPFAFALIVLSVKSTLHFDNDMLTHIK